MKKSNRKRNQHNNHQYVLAVVPGKRSEIMTLQESKDILGRFAQHEKVSMVPTFDLMMVYDERAILSLGDEIYLTGPAVIYAPENDGYIRSLTLEDLRQPGNRWS